MPLWAHGAAVRSRGEIPAQVVPVDVHLALAQARGLHPYITRSLGRPAEGVHALQLEMSQRLYMEEDSPFRYLKERAEKLKPTLEAVLLAFLSSAAQIAG